MKHFRIYTGLALIGCIAFSGCNGSSSAVPSPSPTPQISNISGDYTGTLTDSKNGSGAASGALAQHGSSAGGSLSVALTGGTITAQMSLAITSSNALAGAMVVDYADGTTCTFGTTGTYTNNGSTSATINGSYTAVTGCTGQTGTYTLNQQCVDTITSAERRTFAYPAHC